MGAAIVLLNLGLSFDNLWPTPWVTLDASLSVEAALLVVALAVYTGWFGSVLRRWSYYLAVGFTCLVASHYLIVTTAGLYGRPINLYWDTQHIPRVTQMFTEVTPGWLLTVVVLSLVVILTSIYLGAFWAISSLGDGFSRSGKRQVAGVVGISVTVLFLATTFAGLPVGHWFSPPVTKTFAQQAMLILETMSASGSKKISHNRTLAASTLSQVAGADVLIVFVESYGAASFDNPTYARKLSASRASLANALDNSNFRVVSAMVESPTFAGVSWLAHASVLFGVHVGDNHTYESLLKSQRETLIDRFSKAGYRPVALMPGLKRAWPQGDFYRYEKVYDEPALGYTGPQFGWWRIPDQYALAVLHERELSSSTRAPVFAVCATINTHMPFRPIPPFQPDWQRVITNAPYSSEAIAKSRETLTDWTDVGAGYADSLIYTMTYLESYLVNIAPPDLVLIVLGDHQPASIVSGAGATFEVPVHVISNRDGLLQPSWPTDFSRVSHRNVRAWGQCTR